MKRIYLFIFVCFISLGTQAQFSPDPANPLLICTASGNKGNVQALNDDLSPTGGYYAFWLDERLTPSYTRIYGQHLDRDGNLLWESEGRLIQTTGTDINAFSIKRWQNGFLLSYIVKSDTVCCMYIDEDGANIWPNRVDVAYTSSSVLQVSAAGCFDVFPTTTGASITYYITFLGFGGDALGYNKIDFNGNVSWGNNEHYYQLSGYDYKATSDGENGFYALSKGNGAGSTITIDRINDQGVKVWSSGLDVTGGGGTLGHGGNINMNIDSNNDLYVTWDSYGGNILHSKVLKNGTFGWGSQRIALSLLTSAKRSSARVKNDTSYITWIETLNGLSYTMLQKVDDAGNIYLPNGGATIDLTNDYYSYPKLAFGGDTAMAFYTKTLSSLGIVAQGIKPDNAKMFWEPVILSDSYLHWIDYTDYVLLDSSTTCNTIFWTSADSKIFGANICMMGRVLSIKTSSLSVQKIGSSHKLAWESYNENTGSTYEVERSNNSINFTSLTTIPAKGMSVSAKYVFWDNHPLQGYNYYRIKLNDTQGKSEYSNIVRVNNSQATSMLTVFPNPVKDVLTINQNIVRGNNATINIFNMQGKLVKQFHLTPGQQQLNVTSLAKGFYILQYRDDVQTAVIKFEKH